MTRFTVDQVKNLSPDSAAFNSGQGLADMRHWVSLGSNDAALWGECKGSGKEPYKVRIDLSNNGSACTCPSRKFPCKHVLGLMLLAATSPARLAVSAPPAWVIEWIEKRSARTQVAEQKTGPKTSSESRQKDAARRAAQREKLAVTGIEALENWLRDLARLGLASAQSVPAAFWDEQAARMVDAQLPGAARQIREMSVLPGARSDWAEVLLLRLGRIYLLCQAYRKLDSLPGPVQQDVRALLGWNVSLEGLLTTAPGTPDDWLVLASRTNEDEKTGLRTQVNWLWGKTNARPAQILNFAFRNQPMDSSLVPGLVLSGELVYFPGAYPVRALFKNKQVERSVFIPSGYPNLSSFLDEYAAALGNNPWLDSFPTVLERVVPLQIGQSWFLRDSQNQALPLAAQFTSSWELYALSGGHPLTIFGLWDGFYITPMTAWTEERCVLL